MKVLTLGYSDVHGGAARAMMANHAALSGAGISNRVQVALKRSNLQFVNGPQGMLAERMSFARRAISMALLSLERSPNKNLRSLSLLPNQSLDKISRTDADIIHLHWVCGEFLSIEDISRLSRPLVWTLHDMWPFCGTEHYAEDVQRARWREGYTRENRLPNIKGPDLDRWTWKRKKDNWKKPIQIVAPSRWLAQCAKESELMRAWPVCVIPYAMDTGIFCPTEKGLAREKFSLPQDKKLVLFGAMGGTADKRKGWNYLEDALRRLASVRRDVECLIIGQDQPRQPPKLNMTLHWMGSIHDDATLAQLYNAADLAVVPSIQDNLPLMGTEAQTCGCPLVAFQRCGLPDVVDHGKTGYLAEELDPESLAKGILWVLEHEHRTRELSVAARKRAVRLWSPEVVGRQHLEVYRAMLEDQWFSTMEGRCPG